MVLVVILLFLFIFVFPGFIFCVRSRLVCSRLVFNRDICRHLVSVSDAVLLDAFLVLNAPCCCFSIHHFLSIALICLARVVLVWMAIYLVPPSDYSALRLFPGQVSHFRRVSFCRLVPSLAFPMRAILCLSGGSSLYACCCLLCRWRLVRHDIVLFSA